MKNFDSAIERINKVKDFDSLNELEKSFERLYKYGFLTEKELLELENSLSMFDILEKWLERTPFLKFNDFKFSEKYVEAVRNMTERERAAILETEYISEKEKEGE